VRRRSVNDREQSRVDQQKGICDIVHGCGHIVSAMSARRCPTPNELQLDPASSNQYAPGFRSALPVCDIAQSQYLRGSVRHHNIGLKDVNENSAAITSSYQVCPDENSDRHRG
jgi:hypothetical protein